MERGVLWNDQEDPTFTVSSSNTRKKPVSRPPATAQIASFSSCLTFSPSIRCYCLQHSTTGSLSTTTGIFVWGNIFFFSFNIKFLPDRANYFNNVKFICKSELNVYHLKVTFSIIPIVRSKN